ncbi:hypothetical protein ACT9XH_00005 [Methanococcoides methylutens]|uniref:hypothetical protein n=1 Tax=Methanococcoides methylutens TaxID=2226 RepID=UPI004043F1B6
MRLSSREIQFPGRPSVKHARPVGIVFQNPDDQVFSPTVEEDVAFGPINMGLSQDEVEERIKTSLELVNLTGFEKRAPHHLSGGQKKLSVSLDLYSGETRPLIGFCKISFRL